MKFRFRPFLFQIKKRCLDIEFVVYAHNWTIYILTSYMEYSRHQMCDIVAEALIESLCAPDRTPDDAPNYYRHSELFDAPPQTHLDALKDRLLFSGEYVQSGPILTTAGERLEFRIDCRQLEQLVIDVRRKQDVEMGKHLVQGEMYASINAMLLRIYHTSGQRFKEWRVREMLWRLEHEEQAIEGNGSLRTKGRNVL